MAEVNVVPNQDVAPIGSMAPWGFWARPDSIQGLTLEEAAAVEALTASDDLMQKAQACALAARNWLIVLPMEIEGRRPS